MLRIVGGDSAEKEKEPSSLEQLQSCVDLLSEDPDTAGEFVIVFSDDVEARILSNAPGLETIVYLLEQAKYNILMASHE
jgi:hypothetical protein